MASGASALPLSTLAAMVNRKMNVADQLDGVLPAGGRGGRGGRDGGHFRGCGGGFWWAASGVQ
jgi:hypothetical protein